MMKSRVQSVDGVLSRSISSVVAPCCRFDGHARQVARPEAKQNKTQGSGRIMSSINKTIIRLDADEPQLSPLLTRELIDEGAIDAMMARDAPYVRILSAAERRASLLETLAARRNEDVWLFGYGSLIWNPTEQKDERHTAHVIGWH